MARRSLVLAAIVAAGVNLRIAVAAVGPLIERIRDDLGMSSTVAGVLNGIPFACMGAFALLGPYVLARYGAARVLVAALALIAVFSVGRAVAPDAALLLALTVPIGLGIALVGVTLPGVVKRFFPVRMGRTTGLYVAAMSAGAAAAAFLMVPLADELGGWRPALALTAVPAAAAFAIWLRGRTGSSEAGGESWPLRLPTRAHVILGLPVAAISMSFLGMVSWLAAIYQEAGWSDAQAAAAVGAILLVAAPASVVLPGLSDGRNRPVWTAAAATLTAIGVAGVAIAPTVAAPLWLAAFAIGNGAFFPLTLTLPLDVAGPSDRVALATAWALGIGFLLGALSPVGIGALRDATGGFTLPMILLSIVCVSGGLAALALNRPGVASRA